jgi:pimeloyl-ACP methyl ester carboxylesterase
MRALADHLVEHYTVLTYDRRGLSRSPITDPQERIRVETHAHDAHMLLDALATEPALVLGISIGALVGLDLVAHHPEQVRVLVAHEPPATELLPSAARAPADRAREDVEETFRKEGVPAAMQKFLAIAGVNFADREPNLDLPGPTPQRAANLVFFLTHDAPAARHYRLDAEALKAASPKIIPAAGRTSMESFPNHCARALAELLGVQVVLFPGDHSGPLLHPKAFAARLHEVLAVR